VQGKPDEYRLQLPLEEGIGLAAPVFKHFGVLILL